MKGLGRRVSPGAQRLGQGGHGTLVLVQKCTLICQQPEFTDKAFPKRHWSIVRILVSSKYQQSL